MKGIFAVIIVLVIFAVVHIKTTKKYDSFSNVFFEDQEKDIIDLGFEQMRCLVQRTTPEEQYCSTVVGISDYPQSSGNPRNFKTF
jgi:hypothetical protein